MGMYTELHFNCRLKRNVPPNVIEILEYMLHKRNDKPALPDHDLFSTGRWEHMLLSDSAYFYADTHSTLRVDEGFNERHVLCIRCNLKNYEGEIEKFVDWIMPYLSTTPDNFLGFSRYEETEQPTLLFATEAVGEYD